MRVIEKGLAKIIWVPDKKDKKKFDRTMGQEPGK